MNAPFGSNLPERAEQFYFFRHALLRDAAYQLQLPGDRERLHGLALAALEELCGGRAPEAPPPGTSVEESVPRHPTDPFAEELAERARLAGSRAELLALEETVDLLLRARRTYLRRAAEFADRTYRSGAAARLWGAHWPMRAGDGAPRSSISTVEWTR